MWITYPVTRETNWLEPFLEASEISSQEELAELLGVSRATINRLAQDHAKLKRDRAEHMARLLNTTVEALMLNRPPLAPGEYVRVPLDDAGNEITPDLPPAGAGYDREHYEPAVPGAIPELDVKAGAGEGAVGEIVVIPVGAAGVISSHLVLDEWLLPDSWLREAVRDPARAIVMAIEGDSMLPNYAPGDRVIIDLSATEMRADGVYLITDGDSPPQVKRLQRIMFTVPQRVAIISDNPAYDKVETELAAVKVLGKISAYVGRR